MPYIIGTAGHIDHGKTSLVRALTGQDTDRLKEEKERGISIELGFAHFDLPDGTQAGVVDVPGHERFIRHMLAGAHGIDLVLFTVAADDGVMPQTEEHLDIVHLLGVRRAIFVITKTDLVAEARIREVEEEVAALVAGTVLDGSPTVPFSAVSGRGLEELRARIADVVRSDAPAAPDGYFRLPVDRVFVMQGHGVVVTGTAITGEVRVGDHVRCVPGDQIFRVRSLQVHGQAVEAATWGQRVAMNLTGSEKASIERGQVICHEKVGHATTRFDARIEVRPTAASGLKNHQRVRVHLGAAEGLARLILLDGREAVRARDAAFAQLVLLEPMLALRGDRFVIRDETAQRTLGGGMVLHPWAPRHRRTEPQLPEKLATLAGGDVAAVVTVFLEDSESFAVALGPVAQFLNTTDEHAAAQLEAMTDLRVVTVDGDRLFTTPGKWEGLKDGVTALLREFHREHPLQPGREMEDVRERRAGTVPPRVFRAVVDRLVAERAIARDGSLLRMPDHVVRLREDEQGMAGRIRALLEQAPLSPPDVKQIERDLGVAPARLTEVLRVLERERAIVRVSPDLYFLSASIDRVKAELRQHLSERSEITPATFRDLFGTTRKYAIPLLEYLDREGVTIRVGDSRRLKRAS
ncbi:MAG: selenocysteine-specific translation elongation factor [Acidimicrobiia bacterium]|nr:selenocysteine-specific translation elongation factor [Acidimicrobiia bacterium]